MALEATMVVEIPIRVKITKDLHSNGIDVGVGRAGISDVAVTLLSFS